MKLVKYSIILAKISIVRLNPTSLKLRGTSREPSPCSLFLFLYFDRFVNTCYCTVMNSKLEFIIDRDYDARMIYEMLVAQKKSKDLEYQSENMGISLTVAKKIASVKSYKEAGEIIQPIVRGRYKELLPQLEKAREEYQKSWDKINNAFFERLEELTRFPMQHKKFYCVISAFHIGISNWGGNKIVRKYDEGADKQRKITAHELIISHIFSFARAKYPRADDRKIWQLTEVYAFVITALDAKMRSLWPWEEKEINIGHNYPELLPLQKKYAKVIASGNLKKYLAQGLKE